MSDPVFLLQLLNGDNGFEMNGAFGDNTGVSGVTLDINLDGRLDSIVGADLADPDGLTNAGLCYAFLGRDSYTSPIDLTTLEATGLGFFIKGLAPGDRTGFSLAAVDMNQDGNKDLIIGAPLADPAGRSDAGVVYVLFSDIRLNTTIDLSTLNGTNGFVIRGIEPDAHTGRSVSSAGYPKGDGEEALIIGAPEAGGGVGASFVVNSRNIGFNATEELSNLVNGIDGFTFEGEEPVGNAGSSVASGDLNRDGRTDQIMGAPRAGSDAGKVYVLYGRDTGFSATEKVSALNGTNGFVIEGDDAPGGRCGSSVVTGDMNKDGILDLFTGSPRANSDAGKVYVIFGNDAGFTKTVKVSTLNGANGFAVTGVSPNDLTGAAVSYFGGENPSMLIGAPQAELTGGPSFTGSSYVLYSKNTSFSSLLNPSTLDGDNGFRIDGYLLSGLSGSTVAPAGDANNDGYQDIFIGAPGANSGYVVFGTSELTTTTTSSSSSSSGSPDTSAASHLEAGALDFLLESSGQGFFADSEFDSRAGSWIEPNAIETSFGNFAFNLALLQVLYYLLKNMYQWIVPGAQSRSTGLQLTEAIEVETPHAEPAENFERNLEISEAFINTGSVSSKDVYAGGLNFFPSINGNSNNRVSNNDVLNTPKLPNQPTCRFR